MIRDLDIALLRTFVAVADAASMTAAANALHRTQGAVSQQVKRLEQSLGTALFARSPSGLRLTPAGERLVGPARRLLALNDEIWTEMTETAIGGAVRLGVPYDLVGCVLTPALRRFVEACPQVEVSLSFGSSPELLERLADGTVDLALVEEPAGAASGECPHYECLGVERLVWAGARGGAALRRRPLPVSMVAESCAFRPFVLDALDRAGIGWRTVFENGNLEATTATVRTDLAVTAWLESTVPADLDVLGPDSGLPALPNFAITLRRSGLSQSPAVDALAHCLREATARQPRAA